MLYCSFIDKWLWLELIIWHLTVALSLVLYDELETTLLLWFGFVWWTLCWFGVFYEHYVVAEADVAVIFCLSSILPYVANKLPFLSYIFKLATGMLLVLKYCLYQINIYYWSCIVIKCCNISSDCLYICFIYCIFIFVIFITFCFQS